MTTLTCSMKAALAGLHAQNEAAKEYPGAYSRFITPHGYGMRKNTLDALVRRGLAVSRPMPACPSLTEYAIEAEE